MRLIQKNGFNPRDVEYWKSKGWTDRKRPWKQDTGNIRQDKAMINVIFIFTETNHFIIITNQHAQDYINPNFFPNL